MIPIAICSVATLYLIGDGILRRPFLEGRGGASAISFISAALGAAARTVALPFGAATGRRNVYVGVASSILICFTYYVLAQIGLYWGTSGSVWPAFAAWMPNLFFAVLGFVLIFRIR